MIKAILLFIKTHAVATAITTTAVVGTTVAAPIVVENIKLENKVKQNLDMLVSSNFQVSSTTNTNEIKNEVVNEIVNEATNETVNEVTNEITNDTKITENNQQENVNNNEPLTFKIVRIEKDYENGDHSVEHKIVPSYDKDYSKWTKEDKEAYSKALDEAARLSQEEHQRAQAEQEQALLNAELELQKEINSWSKEYSCGVGTVSYNSYTKKYKGSYTSEVIKTPDPIDSYSVTYSYKHTDIDNVSAEEFRNTIYPILLQKFEEYKKIDEYIFQPGEDMYRANLNEVYHLSD